MEILSFSNVGKKVIEGGGWREMGKTWSGCVKADRDRTGWPLGAMATFALHVLDTTEDSLPQGSLELSSDLTFPGVGKRACPPCSISSLRLCAPRVSARYGFCRSQAPLPSAENIWSRAQGHLVRCPLNFQSLEWQFSHRSLLRECPQKSLTRKREGWAEKVPHRIVPADSWSSWSMRSRSCTCCQSLPAGSAGQPLALPDRRFPLVKERPSEKGTAGMISSLSLKWALLRLEEGKWSTFREHL